MDVFGAPRILGELDVEITVPIHRDVPNYTVSHTPRVHIDET